jgi:hypothetical protein
MQQKFSHVLFRKSCEKTVRIMEIEFFGFSAHLFGVSDFNLLAEQ